MKQFRDSRYYVTEEGEVFKYHPPRTYKKKDGGTQKWVKTDGVIYGPKERWYKMKPTKRKNGYLVFNLQCPSLTNKGYFNTSVHRMVAECYIGPCPEGKVVDHIDNNRQNNHYTNLQYLTPEENIAKNPKNSYRNWRHK